MDWSIWLFFSFFFGSYISTRIFPLYNKTKASKHMSSQHRTWRWVMNPKVWPKWAMIWRSGAALPRDAGWNLADFFLGLKFASPSKLFLGGCYPDIHDISNFQAWNEILVDEYEIFLDASHFRIPLIFSFGVIFVSLFNPLQKKIQNVSSFSSFLFKFAGFRGIFSRQVPSHAKRQEILWWIVGGGQGGRVAATVRYKLHPQDQTRTFSLKPLPLHPFGTLKRRSQKGWWVETFFSEILIVGNGRFGDPEKF